MAYRPKIEPALVAMKPAAIDLEEFSMKAISRILFFAALALSLTAVTGAVQALTMSGEAKGKTCSQLAGECVSFNKAGGFDVSRCADYKATCMTTGTYSDKKRTITGATKK
jgi:hypothetical protein